MCAATRAFSSGAPRREAGGPRVHGFVHGTLCDPAGRARRQSLAAMGVRQPARPGRVPENEQDTGDLRRAAHNPATYGRTQMMIWEDSELGFSPIGAPA
jgi:hypothetical protein